MDFRYKDYFEAEPSTGYETLIYDCMIGDNILFQRADSVEAGWRAVQPFLDAWKKAGGKGLEIYERPAAKAPRRPTICWSATAEAGESSADDGSRGNRKVIVGGRSGRARKGRGRTRLCAGLPANDGRVAVCLTGGSSPKQLYACSRKSLPNPNPWDRVHWFIGDERFVPATIRSTICARHARSFWIDARPQPTSIRSRPMRPVPTRRATLRTELKSFYGADRARPCPPPVRSGPDGRRPRRPHGLAVSRRSRAGGDRALGRRRAQSQCRAVRAAGHADLAGAQLLPRNAVRGRGCATNARS